MIPFPAGFTIKQARKLLEAENRKWPADLVMVPQAAWPPDGQRKLCCVWRSREYLVQVFDERDGMKRLSVCRTQIGEDGRWKDGVAWEELQIIKSEIGFGDWYGVEVYPRDRDMVNVANMRHLWLMKEPLEIGWFAGRTNG